MKLAPNADDARVGPDCDVGTAAINCLVSSSTRARSTLSSVKATCVPCYLPMRFITTKRVRIGHYRRTCHCGEPCNASETLPPSRYSGYII